MTRRKPLDQRIWARLYGLLSPSCVVWGNAFLRAAALAAASTVCLAAAPPSTRIVTVPAREDVPSHAVRMRIWQADSASPRPLLLYEPGWNGSADENSILLASLSEAGFDVVALDLATNQPPAFAPVLARLQRPLDLSTFTALDRTVAEGDWRVSVLAADALAGLRETSEAAFAPALGILGYSFGGAVAAEVCRLDPRFAACLNMDGWLFGAAAEHPGAQPSMLLSGEAYPAAPSMALRPAAVLDERDAARLRTRMAMAGGFYAQISGLQHGDFTDAGGGNAAVRALVQAFFTSALQHQPSPLLASEHPLPGVTLTRWPLQSLPTAMP